MCRDLNFGLDESLQVNLSAIYTIKTIAANTEKQQKVHEISGVDPGVRHGGNTLWFIQDHS